MCLGASVRRAGVDEGVAEGGVQGEQVVFEMPTHGVAVKDEWRIRLVGANENVDQTGIVVDSIKDSAGNVLTVTSDFDDGLYETFVWDKQIPELTVPDLPDMLIRYEDFYLFEEDVFLSEDNNDVVFSHQDGFSEAFVWVNLHPDDLKRFDLSVRSWSKPWYDDGVFISESHTPFEGSRSSKPF